MYVLRVRCSDMCMSVSLDCHWLDMERHFVEPSSARAGCGSTPGDGGYVLRESLKLDGTHVHPSYVSLLQAALQEISP